MSPSKDNNKAPLDDDARRMAAGVGKVGRRKQEHRRVGDRSFWSSLAFIGMIGWGVALPAVLGGFLGVWLDGRYGSGIRWTLSLLMLGLGMGCWNAWRLIHQERD